MLEINEMTYAAIITIDLPGMDQSATATVTLAPSDKIATETGQVKALRDCTLADLQDFADKLEAEVWAEYESASLAELAEDENSRVKITILNETGQPLTNSAEEWMAQSVILSKLDELLADESADTADEDEPVEAELVAEVLEDEEADEVVAPAGVSSPTSTEPETEEVEDSDEEDPEAETTEPEDEVAEPSDETVETHPTPQPRKDFRILGLRRPSYHPTAAAADILINEPAFRDAQAHSLTSLNKEVAGVLIGPRPEQQEDGRYVVHITDIIIAKHTRMQGASVTYTPESWRYIHDVLAERYPNEEAVIVGWYHTHPGFGIFLSGMDLFIHQNFFTQPWHIAFVLDPVARRSGFFTWNRPQQQVERYDFPWPRWAATSW